MSQLDGETTGLRELISRTSLTLNGAGRFLGVEGRTIRRWVNDGDAPPESVVMLLVVMDHHGLTPGDVQSIMDAYGYP